MLQTSHEQETTNVMHWDNQSVVSVTTSDIDHSLTSPVHAWDKVLDIVLRDGLLFLQQQTYAWIVKGTHIGFRTTLMKGFDSLQILTSVY